MSESLLVVGSGGREHALGYTLGQATDNLLFLPGNGGTLDIGENIIHEVTDIEAIAGVARSSNAFTVVGPDLPLELGIVDYFDKLGLPIFGPTRSAAKLEWSKWFAAAFNEANDIPQANFVAFDDYDKALKYALSHDPLSYVIKADGLAGGKGVVLPKTHQEAQAHLIAFMKDRIYGKSGDIVLFQERLEGPELSVFALCDGENYIMLPSFRDHKRLLDGNRGPNTGGMGVYGPVEVDNKTAGIIENQVINKVLQGMNNRSTPYRGMLYVGLMLTAEDPKVIEYNARFGDPECQAQMLLAQNDLYPALQAAAAGKLARTSLNWWAGQVVTVAVTADGYPGSPRKGDEIHGFDSELPEDVVVFQAGTKRVGDKIVTDGGRILHIASWGETLAIARSKAYQAIGQTAVHFRGMHYRKDIGLE